MQSAATRLALAFSRTADLSLPCSRLVRSAAERVRMERLGIDRVVARPVHRRPRAVAGLPRRIRLRGAGGDRANLQMQDPGRPDLADLVALPDLRARRD